MKLIYLLPYILFLSTQAYAKPIKIAIIDTGYSLLFEDKGYAVPKFCKTGSYDAVEKLDRIYANQPHGTIVSDIIAANLVHVDYCLMEFRVGKSDKQIGELSDHVKINMRDVYYSIMLAVDRGANVINISLAGETASPLERRAIEYALRHRVEVFVAAGNDNTDLSKTCNIYPACYKGIGFHTIMAVDRYNQKCKASNYGVSEKAYGGLVYKGDYQCATSFATPRALSSYVLRLKRKRMRTQMHETPLGRHFTNMKAGIKMSMITDRNG